MGDSDESWSGGDESNSSENAASSEAETSDTDEDIKYTTYPTRGVRWRIGGAGRPQGWEKIKDPKEKRKLWRQGEGIRPAEQRNMDEYVPGRLPYLTKWIKDSEVAEKGASFEPRPSIKAICQRCQKRIPYSADSKELLKHMETCWAAGPEPPVSENDGREHRPNLLGEVAAEVDTTCQLFTIHSPGPYGGAYLLLVALPSKEGTLEKLDTLLRKFWFPDVDNNSGRVGMKHLSMFMMSQTCGMDRMQLKMELQRLELSVRGSDDDLRARLQEHWSRSGGAKKDVHGVHWASVVLENEAEPTSTGKLEEMDDEESVCLEDRLYRGFLPNGAALELAGMGPGVSVGLLTPGRVVTVRVWTEEGPEVWWPAVCIPETSSGLLGKVDGEKGRYRLYEEGALWHCVFINRGNKRHWVRPHYRNMMPHFAWRYPEKGLTLETEAEVEQCVKQHTVKPAPDNATGQYLDFKDMEEKEQWLEAFREAVRLYYLESDQAVLKRCQELGMTGDGDLVPTISYQLQKEVESAMTCSTTKPIEEKEKAKWSFLKPQPDKEHPVPLPVRKEAGFSYWPLMGGSKMDRSSLLIPDRTDQSTASIFTQPGQTAFYHFDLAEGFTSRCRLTYQGEQVVRLRGTLDPTWIDQGRLERDPEWERDMKALNQGSTNFDPLAKYEESSKKIEFRLPAAGEPVVVARNEAPFVPCMQCGDKVAQWCQVRSSCGASSWASWEDPDLRLSQTIHLCSMPCGLAWSGGGDRNNKVEGKEQLGDHETDMMMQLGNSPRSGIPYYGYNTAKLRLHVMHEGLLWNEYVRPWRHGSLLPGFSMYKVDSEAGFGTWPSTQRPGWKKDVEYCDDERPRYRHHPLWPKQERKTFRSVKHNWQDKILARVRHWGLEVPPCPTHDQLYFD